MLTRFPHLIIKSTPASFPFIYNASRIPIASFHSSSRRLFRESNFAMAPKEYLCIIPDKPGTLAKRLEVRPQHLEGVKPLVAAGKVVVGGAMFDSHPVEGETPSFKGSALICIAETEEEVKEVIWGDVYTRTGVWDVDAAQIIPFKSAVRVAV